MSTLNLRNCLNEAAAEKMLILYSVCVCVCLHLCVLSAPPVFVLSFSEHVHFMHFRWVREADGWVLHCGCFVYVCIMNMMISIP